MYNNNKTPIKIMERKQNDKNTVMTSGKTIVDVDDTFIFSQLLNRKINRITSFYLLLIVQWKSWFVSEIFKQYSILFEEGDLIIFFY